MKKALLILGLVFLVGCEEAEITREVPVAAPEVADDVQDYQIRAMLIMERLDFKGRALDLDFALDMTSYLHHMIPLISVNERLNYVNRAENVRLLLTDPTYGHICGGIAITNLDVFRAFGFKARGVQLFSAEVDNHAVTEVEIDGRWIAIDGTFNAVFVDDQGDLMGYKQVFDLWRNEGRMAQHQYIDTPERFIEDYYIPYSNLLDHGRGLPVYSRNNGNFEVVQPGQEIF